MVELAQSDCQVQAVIMLQIKYYEYPYKTNWTSSSDYLTELNNSNVVLKIIKTRKKNCLERGIIYLPWCWTWGNVHHLWCYFNNPIIERYTCSRFPLFRPQMKSNSRTWLKIGHKHKMTFSIWTLHIQIKWLSNCTVALKN